MAWVMTTKGTPGRVEVAIGGLKIATINAGKRRPGQTHSPWYLKWDAPVVSKAPSSSTMPVSRPASFFEIFTIPP